MHLYKLLAVVFPWMYWSLYYFFHGTLLGRIDIFWAKVVKIYEIGKKIENLCYF